MPRHRFGFNANDRSYGESVLVPLSQRLNARVFLVMNSPATAQKVYEANRGEVIVISRSNWPDDTASIPYDRLVAQWSAERARFRDVHFYFPNEPVVSGREDLRRLLNELVTFMRKLETAGVKAVVGNFAWANILNHEDVEAGVWDNFIREASRWTNAGGGFIGGHDYTSGALPWGAAKRNPYDMLEPGLLGRDRWPTQQEVLEDKWRDNWLMLRWVMLAKRAEVLGVPMFKMIVTEAPWDRMPNLELPVQVAPGVWRDGVVRLLDALLGYARGPLDQRKWFRRWWPQWSETEAAMEQIKWLDEVYPDYVVGFTFFALNNDEQWRSFDFMQWPELLDTLAAYNKEGMPVINMENYGRYLARPKGNYRVTFRSEPVANAGNILGYFEPDVDAEILHFPLTEDNESSTVVAGSNSYIPVRWAGIMGWVAQNYMSFTPVEEQPAPDPDLFYRDALAQVGDRISTIAQDIQNLLS